MITLHNYLTVNSFQEVLFEHNKIELSRAVIDRVDNCYEFLKNFSKNKIIYGVNTGFGPMAQYRVQESDQLQLQYNLIRSHSTGTGQPLSAIHAKAAVLARLNTLSLGKSGIHIDALLLMKELLNHDVIPLIFSHGGVGASGDLVQLAHLALVLIGEGEVFYQNQRKPAKEVFALLGLSPLEIKIREGLAIINGTSVMTGIGIVNAYYARKLLDWSVKASCFINELMQAYDDHFSAQLNAAKLHSGQRKIAQMMRQHLADSSFIKRRQEHLYTGQPSPDIFKGKIQEFYSLRCVPQILGPVLDTIDSVEEVLEKEINSANDNPIIDVESQDVYHGGNFHGDYIALEMDRLKLVVTKMSMLAERQINYLLNSKINELLPPFINLGKLGLNFGMQGAQFTATSTTAENQALSTSLYIHSIPNNNDNQDIVSMGTNAALMCSKVIENSFEVLAIQWIAIFQAVESLNAVDKLSSESRILYEQLRNIVPVLKEDIALYPIIKQVVSLLQNPTTFR